MICLLCLNTFQYVHRVELKLIQFTYRFAQMTHMKLYLYLNSANSMSQIETLFGK